MTRRKAHVLLAAQAAPALPRPPTPAFAATHHDEVVLP